MAANKDLVHGWVSTDCGRGTSDILWSCLATILLCVWTVIHLPVPCLSRFEQGRIVPGEPERSWRNWIIRSGIIPALISVIAPEVLTFIAVTELITAWQSKRELRAMKWTLTHTFFLYMGGFCLETPSGLRLQLDDDTLASAISNPPDWLSKLKEVEVVQINDHAKSNSLTKSIACGQALWLITQVISRICQHQAVTILEVSTLAYAACALTAYAAWWKKPQSSNLPITIPCSTEVITQRPTVNPLYYSKASMGEYLWAGQNPGRSPDWYGESLVLAIFWSTLFGAIHVASWNITLPSNVEQWLWRASALCCCTVGMVSSRVFLNIITCLPWIGPGTAEASFFTMWLVIALFYVTARLFMIVEVFLSLRALPRSAYESVQWSSFIPHI